MLKCRTITENPKVNPEVCGVRDSINLHGIGKKTADIMSLTLGLLQFFTMIAILTSFIKSVKNEVDKNKPR